MDTKAAFEKWLKDEYTWGAEALDQCRWQPFGKGDGYYICNERYDFLHFMFVAWAASRAEIEIELPEEKPYKHNSYPEARAQDDGFNDALSECITIITSHGIRIKGKTE